ncbi:venom protease [Anoplophora glabripennis]|uniref:venom protease n=1 Tax=Anoplophora glabripennis TaxID=217634 RepID=UPI0008741977|nr:venom protease [Anoplophora glabripennis]
MMCILVKYFLVFCITSYLHKIDALYSEGSNCDSGTCKRIINCPPAVESMAKNGVSGLKRCGFTYPSNDELVCCPSLMKGPSDNNIIVETSDSEDSESSSTEKMTTTVRSSKEFCEKVTTEFKASTGFRILDGEEAAANEYPYMAALGYKENDESEPEWKCGATVISNNFLITAAHCIRRKSQIKPTIVRLGVTKLNEENAQDFLIKKTKIYPDYHSKSRHNDIALIELHRNITFNKIYPACLYLDDEVPSPLFATGWGATGSNSMKQMSNILRVAKMDPESNSDCNEYFLHRSLQANSISDAQFCAKYNTGDTCSGDSGGPIQVKKDGIYYIVGITSYGIEKCEKRNLPAVFTKVSKYVEWIDKIIYGNKK